jgi:hypothetical protein
MKRYLAIVLVSLSLGGCAQLSAISGGLSLVTKTIQNPVTEQELYQIEASIRILTEALLTYRRACIAGSADLRCRANIEAIQPYTRQVPPMLAQLRGFVRNNDQINAVVLYNQLTQLYTNVKSSAAQLGVPLGV